MAILNSIAISQLELGRRLDAECYHKDKWDADRRIRALPHTTLGLLLTDFSAGDNAPQRELAAGLQPFIRTQNVRPVLLSETGLSATAMTWDHALGYGDIVAVRVGEGVGDVSVVGTQWNGAAFSDNVLRLKIRRLNPFFVTVYLNTNIGKLIFERFKKGTARSLVSRDNFTNIPVPIFGEVLQTVVEEFVNKAYALHHDASLKYKAGENLLLAGLNLLEWKPQAALTYVRNFNQAVQAQRLDAEHFKPMYDEAISRVNFYEPIKLSKTAQQVAIPVSFDLQKTYRYIEIGDVETSTGVVGFTEREVKDLPPNAKIKVSGGELIISKVRPTRGAVGIVPAECENDSVCSSAFVVLKVASPMREFLQIYLRSPIGKLLIEKPCRGTSYPTVDDIDVNTMLIPTLPGQVVDQIAEYVQKSHHARREAKALLDKAKSAVEIAIEQSEAAALAYLNG